MKFDKDRCLKLLKKNKILQNEGKSLRDYDKTENDELINYISLVEDHILGGNRKKYIQLLDLFVSKKITFDQFFKQFGTLRGSDLRLARMWKKKLEKEAFVNFSKSTERNIQFNSKFCGFTKIISDIHSLLDEWSPDVTLDMNLQHPELLFYGISEEYLRLTIEKNFLPQLKKYFIFNLHHKILYT